MIPDLINGLFELMGALFLGLSIKKLYKEKVVRGISWIHVAYFAAWGLWNLFFYPYVGAMLSFTGGAVLAVTNIAYTVMLLYYTIKDRKVAKP